MENKGEQCSSHNQVVLVLKLEIINVYFLHVSLLRSMVNIKLKSGGGGRRRRRGEKGEFWLIRRSIDVPLGKYKATLARARPVSLHAITVQFNSSGCQSNLFGGRPFALSNRLGSTASKRHKNQSIAHSHWSPEILRSSSPPPDW